MTSSGLAHYVQVYGATLAFDEDGDSIDLSPKARDLLALLVAAGPTGLTTEQLIASFYPNPQSANLQSKLRVDLSRLRLRIGERALPKGRGRWRIALSNDAVDHFSLTERVVGDPCDELLVARMFAGSPFREAPESAIVEAARRRSTAAREMLLSELTRGGAALLTPTVRQTLRASVLEGPRNDEHLAQVLEAHLAAGATSEARKLLADADELTSQEDGVLGVHRQLRRRVRDGIARQRPTLRTRSLNRSGEVFVGREAPLDEVRGWLAERSSVAAQIVGDSGMGKTQFLHRVIAQVDPSRSVVWLVGRRSAQSAFGAWREAVPSMSPLFSEFLRTPSADDPLVAKATFWDDAQLLLLDVFFDPVFVVDDVQWLDSQSLELLMFLVRTAESRMQFLISGLPPSVADWAELSTTSLGGPQIALNGLTLAELERLVALLRPKAPMGLRTQVARELKEQSGGLPRVARLLLERSQGEAVLPQLGSATPLSPPLEGLEGDDLRVALAIAVEGQSLEWERLVQRVALSDEAVLEAIEALTALGVVVVEATNAAPISLRNAAIRDAIFERSPDTERWKMHLAASRDAVTIHQRAEHEYHALPLVPAHTSTLSLLESASTHFREGAMREAVRAFERAVQRTTMGEIPSSSLIEWSAARDRLGLDGHELRRAALERAIADDDLSLALEAAASGLPEAEWAVGDERRVSLLLSIAHDDLPIEQQFAHAIHCGRQLAVAGREKQANEWLDRSALLAADAEEESQVVLARWLLGLARPRGEDRFRGLTLDPDATDMPLVLQHQRGVMRLHDGDLEAANQNADVVERRMIDQPSSYVRWHHLMFAATRSMSAGRISEGANLADQAFLHSVRYGIREGGSAWLAQTFMSVWMQRGAGELLPQMRSGSSDTRGSFLAEAAYALALSDAGDWSEATSNAEDITKRALRHESFAGDAALLLTARVLRTDSRLSSKIRERLAPLEESLAVVGGGFACLGPVEVALAFLTEGSIRDAHIRRSIQRVDQLGLHGWQVAVRLELSRSFGVSRWKAEAEDLADGLDWDINLPFVE